MAQGSAQRTAGGSVPHASSLDGVANCPKLTIAGQSYWHVDEGQTLTIEELINLQEAGSRARVLGLGSDENPYVSPDCTRPNDNAQEERQARLDAWKFGWEAEKREL